MHDDFTFPPNNYCWYVVTDQTFSDAQAEQWPNFQLTTVQPYSETPVILMKKLY